MMSSDPRPETRGFYDLADRFIGLANEQTRDHPTSRVSSVIMYAAARYNAHCVLALDPEAAKNRAAATDYLVEQYRRMLENNMDELMRSSKPGT
jgi:hypothetical protein